MMAGKTDRLSIWFWGLAAASFLAGFIGSPQFWWLVASCMVIGGVIGPAYWAWMCRQGPLAQRLHAQAPEAFPIPSFSEGSIDGRLTAAVGGRFFSPCPQKIIVQQRPVAMNLTAAVRRPIRRSSTPRRTRSGPTTSAAASGDSDGNGGDGEPPRPQQKKLQNLQCSTPPVDPKKFLASSFSLITWLIKIVWFDGCMDITTQQRSSPSASPHGDSELRAVVGDTQ
jgi:hypothetical protein